MSKFHSKTWVILVTVCLTIFTVLFTPPAWAMTQIQLSDLSYEDCPTEFVKGNVSSGSVLEAGCIIIRGKAENGSGKPVMDADVFGRIYDANNNSAMENRGRLGAIEMIPPGVSDFEIRVSVPAVLKKPLRLEKFKAAGFTSAVRW